MFRLSLEARILCVGEAHSLVANTHFEYSAVLQMLGKLDDAVDHARKALAIRQNIFPVSRDIVQETTLSSGA